MSTTRRRGKAKYEDLIDPPEKVVKAARRAGRVSQRRWILYGIGLVLTIVFFYNFVPRASDTELEYEAKKFNKGEEAKQAPQSSWLNNDSDTFVVVDLPGKGKGMVAVRDIEQGERILTEKPAIVAPDQVTEPPAALIGRLLREISPESREAVLNLSYVNFPKDLDAATHPEEVALAIIQTNGVATTGGVGIFPRMARMNHGCSSAFNAIYTWRDKEGVLVVHALKRIRQGEEILTTYTNTKRPRAERRALLLENYGFTCMCKVCALPDNESQVSDKRLMAISDAYARFAQWGQKAISGVEAIEAVQIIWSIENEEEYWSERGRLAADAAYVAAAHSDATATKNWAKLAIQWYIYELGLDSEQVREMRGILDDPQSHPGWGSREAQEVGDLGSH